VGIATVWGTQKKELHAICQVIATEKHN